MEAYKTTCQNPVCKYERFWVGYKTGLGKTPEQLEQMGRNEKTCRKCGATNATTELDRETEIGRAYGEHTAHAAQMIAALIAEKLGGAS